MTDTENSHLDNSSISVFSCICFAVQHVILCRSMLIVMINMAETTVSELCYVKLLFALHQETLSDVDRGCYAIYCEVVVV